MQYHSGTGVLRTLESDNGPSRSKSRLPLHKEIGGFIAQTSTLLNHAMIRQLAASCSVS